MRMIARSNSAQRPARSRSLCRSFTLTELLVAMGIIVIIAGVTAVGVQRIARQARVANATNTVIASLDTARAIAIRDNRITMVVFRPRQDGNAVFVEMVIAQQPVFGGEISGGDFPIVERFIPRDDVQTRRLPDGIKVAAPRFGTGADDFWFTQSHFPTIDGANQIGEQPGRLIAVMYSPSGMVITRNSAADTNRSYLDFNRNGLQDYGGETYDYSDPSESVAAGDRFDQWAESDESFLNFAEFIAVYDDSAARDQGDPSGWSDESNYISDLVGPLPENPDEPGAPLAYISRNADRIYFNRYTGVVLR